MSADRILEVVIQYGLPTFLLFALVYFYVRERNAWDAERKELYKSSEAKDAARIQDARDYASALAKMQESTNQLRENGDKLIDGWDKFRDYDRTEREKERERERDRDDRINRALTATGPHSTIDVTKRPR